MNIARGMAALSMVALSAPAAAASQVNPQGSGPIVSALMWLQGHFARQCRNGSGGHRRRHGRLHDADWSNELALRSDGHHRLLHPLRVRGNRQRHPIDGGSGGLIGMALSKSPVFRALTRPQMFAGVTYSYFIINAAVTTEAFLITRSLLALPVALAVHVIGYFACLREPRIFDLWITKVSRCPRTRNWKRWGCNSYAP
jgi:type IV secretion system protein VirB3